MRSRKFALFALPLFVLLVIHRTSAIASEYSTNPTAGYPYNDYSSSYSYYPPAGSDRSAIISLDLDPKTSLNTAFRIAARENRLPDIRKLLEQGAEINSKSNTGETALIYVAKNCFGKAAELLLEAKADVNARDSHGRSALIHATIGSCAPVVQALLRNPGVDLKLRDTAGKTAADYAEEASLMEVDGPAPRIVQLIRGAEKRKSRRL